MRIVAILAAIIAFARHIPDQFKFLVLPWLFLHLAFLPFLPEKRQDPRWLFGWVSGIIPEPMTVDAFSLLLAELDRWAKADMTAGFWWRDDDAGESCEALDRLVRLSETFGVPCGLATIPARAGEPLRNALSGTSAILVLQHGYAHVNHAPKGNGAWELGLHRPASEVLEELRTGMLALKALFGDRFVPVVVPPWNKMDPGLYPYLPVMGFRGISASYKRHRPVPPGDLRVADAHCDVLRWKKPDKIARFAGAEQCVDHMVSHLRDKRTGYADDTEPTGVLTHHLEMDPDAWNFMEALFSLTGAHPAAEWLNPASLWPPNRTEKEPS